MKGAADPVRELEVFTQSVATRSAHPNGERAPCKDIDTLLGSTLGMLIRTPIANRRQVQRFTRMLAHVWVC
jgi:hypothetical protein